MQYHKIQKIKENGIVHEVKTRSDGTIHWRLEDGNLHREKGPAVIHPDGELEWWIDGNYSIFVRDISSYKKGGLFGANDCIIVSTEKVFYKDKELLKVGLYSIRKMRTDRYFLIDLYDPKTG